MIGISAKQRNKITILTLIKCNDEAGKHSSSA